MYILVAALGFAFGLSGGLVATVHKADITTTAQPLRNATIRRLQGTVVSHSPETRTIIVEVDSFDPWNIPGKSRVSYTGATDWRTVHGETDLNSTKVTYRSFVPSSLAEGMRVRMSLTKDTFNTLIATEVVIE